MSPKELVLKCVDLFNQGDADQIALLYHEDAVNHRMPNTAIEGRKAIYDMFQQEFAQFDMTCIVENLFEDGAWAILEWKGPNDDMRGCGFFHIVNNKIKTQCGYWDKLTFLKEQGLSISE